MAREKKKIRLKMVDESAVQPARVPRVENQETQQQTKPMRLKVLEATKGSSQRLELPEKLDAEELRTHQPGIEALAELDAADLNFIESSWNPELAKSKPTPWGWFILLGLVLAGGLLWSLTLVRSAAPLQLEQQSSAKSAIEKNQKEDQEASQLVEQIEATTRKFLKAKSIEEIMPLVRHAERVAPLMRKYYATHPFADLHVSEFLPLQPVTLENRANFWQAYTNVKTDKSVPLLVEVLDSGDPKVDWETFVCYQPMDWDVFAKERRKGESLDFRVYLEATNLFSHEFSNSNVWNCYKLTALGSEEVLFGYAKIGSEVATALTDLLEKNSNVKTAAILRMNIPEGIQSRQGVFLEKVMAPRWIYVDSPATED